MPAHRLLPRLLPLALTLGLMVAAPAARALPLILAGENMYGDVAAQVAGPDATVRSVLTNPAEDPHLFEATPSVARDVAGAAVVIANGLGYDPWLLKLVGTGAVDRLIVAATVVGAHPDDNPHLWYDPRTMPAVAHALADRLARLDPPHAAAYRDRAARFDASLQPLRDQIAAMRARFGGTRVAATEPVFGDMASALGLTMLDTGFQLAIMNDTEPSASEVERLEADLHGHQVGLLLINSQASEPIAEHMAGLARKAGIPVVAVSETEPPGTGYLGWMRQQLDAVTAALGRAAPAAR